MKRFADFVLAADVLRWKPRIQRFIYKHQQLHAHLLDLNTLQLPDSWFTGCCSAHDRKTCHFTSGGKRRHRARSRSFIHECKLRTRDWRVLTLCSCLLKMLALIFFSRDRNTPLHVSASYGHVDVSSLLIFSKVDVDARNKEYNPPTFAIWISWLDSCSCASFEKHFQILFFSQNTPLHNSAFNGHVGVSSLLISSKADVDARSCMYGP